jgi:hypothetical protein
VVIGGLLWNEIAENESEENECEIDRVGFPVPVGMRVQEEG